MRRRQLPETWLFTDSRSGDALWPALARLPRGSGVIFRHYDVAAPERAGLLRRVRAATRRRGLLLVIAGQAHGIRGDGVHNRRGAGLLTAAAHGRAQLVAARRRGAQLVFVSPVFATRSHPGGRTLGQVRFGLLIRGAGVPVAALGGMTARGYAALKPLGAMAWGGIDAWIRS